MATSTNLILPPWSNRLIAELHAVDQRAKDLAGGLSLEQLNWQPVPTSWSIGQCLDHLRKTNEVYLAPIADALQGKSPNPVEEIIPGWFSRWFIGNYIEPTPNGKHAPAPKKIVPTSRVEAAILDDFLSSNQATRELITHAGGYNVNRIRFKNPFVAGLRFSTGTGFLIVCTHQRRHLLQAERIRQSSNFPA